MKTPVTPVRRKRSRGANLAILAAVGAMLVGFMGISLYTGVQAFLQNDLQRVTTGAAMAGAAAYYSAVGPGGKPTPNPAGARTIATNAFNTAVSNGSLNGFNAQIVNISNNDSTDSITITSQGTLNTPFLAPIGISQIQANATATARALKYEPTIFTGPVRIEPVSTQLESYSQTIQLAFPMVDGPGNDLYVEQDASMQQGYIVEACNNTQCYSLVPGATPVGTSQILTVNGVQAIYGTAIIDLERAGVRKGDKLRFTHANNFDSYNSGALNPVPLVPTPLEIRRVFIFGYAGACADAQTCSVPAGFEPVE